MENLGDVARLASGRFAIDPPLTDPTTLVRAQVEAARLESERLTIAIDAPSWP